MGAVLEDMVHRSEMEGVGRPAVAFLEDTRAVISSKPTVHASHGGMVTLRQSHGIEPGVPSAEGCGVP